MSALEHELVANALTLREGEVPPELLQAMLLTLTDAVLLILAAHPIPGLR